MGASGSTASEVARPCAGCHRAQYDAWRRSQHASAQRPFDAARDVAPAGVTARGVIGVAPLRQLLVARGGGRVQAFDPALEVATGRWFSVFDDARTPGSWGHWTGRGMNWNAQCAACHTTGFEKGYDARDDTYRSAWDAAGVACAQCHGPMRGHPAHAVDGRPRARAADVCASCHARREELTGSFRAGERFDDHFRLTFADAPGAYHPDGQAADEDFEAGSLALSPMGHRGVACLDCHEPHGAGLRAPVARDQLCLTCHAAGARGAPVVTAAHSHHDPAGAGARCVACHMPEATFMRRDRRRDHGFTVPDPALAEELGLPDACARCHADLTPAARAGHVARWFGDDGRPRRRRARLVARAQRGDATVARPFAEAMPAERNDAWRASMAGLLGAWSDDAAVRAALVRALGDGSPWVRAAAARSLDGAAPAAVAALTGDVVRLVRVDAAWSVRGVAPWGGAARGEVLRWLGATCDQPAGALRRAELAWREGRAAEAREWAARAVAWDPSAPTFAAQGRLLEALGDAAGAARAYGEARQAEALSGGSGAAR